MCAQECPLLPFLPSPRCNSRVPHPPPGPPGPLRVVRFDIVFVFSFDIFDQRQGFGFRAVFVMLCDGPRRGRAGEIREGGLRKGR